MITARPAKSGLLIACGLGILLASCGNSLATGKELSTDASPSPYDKIYPATDAVKGARDDSAFQHAVTAYRFWYPTVSMESVFTANRAAGMKDNEVMPILSAVPRHHVFTANSDTAYGAGVFDLAAGPIVVELPPGPFIALANDHHQGWIMDMGLPGPDQGKGGKHLILPPGYKGTPPKGYFTGRSASNKVLIAIRSIPTKGDLNGALEALRKARIYPLSTAAHPRLVTFVDITGKDMSGPILDWENRLTFWQKLHEALEAEPVVPGCSAMYGELKALGIGKGQTFKPDERMKAILDRAARAGRTQMLVSAFASERPDRLSWQDRRWEWASLVPDDAHFNTPEGLDLEARDRWFIQAILTSPAMFRRTEGQGSLYWLGARDSLDAYLDGGKSYKLTVPLPVPASLFWSVTVYDAGTRTEIATDQQKAALRSMFELKDSSGNAAELYFGPTAPKGHEGHWIKTTPGKDWFAYFRIYGPQRPAFDAGWKPGDFQEIRFAQSRLNP